MLLFIFAQKYLLLKLEPLKNSPFKGPTLHAEVWVCLKKKEIIICVTKFIYGLIEWLTGNVAKCIKCINVVIKCIFKLLIQWINLMQLKGRENGMERVTCRILPSRDPHDCTVQTILAVLQPNIWCTNQCQEWRKGRATKWGRKSLVMSVAL